MIATVTLTLHNWRTIISFHTMNPLLPTNKHNEALFHVLRAHKKTFALKKGYIVFPVLLPRCRVIQYFALKYPFTKTRNWFDISKNMTITNSRKVMSLAVTYFVFYYKYNSTTNTQKFQCLESINITNDIVFPDSIKRNS